MGYDAEIIRRASARLEAGRKGRQAEAEGLKKRLFAQNPELADIDRRLRGTVLDVISVSLQQGRDPRPALQAARERNMDLQIRQARLLQELGYGPDALDDAPMCKTCGDTGWTGARMCGCLKALCAREQVRELTRMLNLGEQSFDAFSLEWYSERPWPGETRSPQKNMKILHELCLEYAQQFGRFSVKNLFLSGDPGLGKTFLSACIARAVAEDGFSVVYDTAVNVFSRFEEQKFGRDIQDGAAARDDTRRYLNCDLLILDDLGSEMTTAFVQSALYTLVNARLLQNRATVISSNLSMDGVRERYNGQIASRLEGEYYVLRFYGEDIRLQKKARL